MENNLDIIAESEFDRWGQSIFTREDGNLWLEVKDDLFRAIVPLDEEVRKLLFKKEVSAWLLECDEEKLIPPAGWLRAVRDELAGATEKCEAVAYLFRKGDKWQAVIPKQDVEESSWDVDDTKPMMAYWGAKGYSLVGHLHLHPGKGCTPSGTDEKEWEKMRGGLYMVAGREGDTVSVFLQITTIRWPLTSQNIGEVKPIKTKVLGQEGEKDWTHLINVKKTKIVGRGCIRYFNTKHLTSTWKPGDRDYVNTDVVEFVAIPYEDARIVKVDGKLYVTGWDWPAATRRMTDHDGRPLKEVIMDVIEKGVKK